jgi:hypothetical protein
VLRQVLGHATLPVVVPLLALAAPLAAQRGGEREPAASAYVVVLAARLNIRSAPALDAPVVAVAERGERLCAMGFDADWVEVRAPLDERGPPQRRSGFVSRGFVSETRATSRQLEEMGCR